jgi:hypothetical protein
MKRVWLPILLLASASSASGAGRSLTTVWAVGDSLLSTDVREVGVGDYVLKHRLLPSGLAELVAGVEGLAPGQQLVEIGGGEALVFCDAEIRSKKLVGHAQPCLVDADRDGRFEGIFHTTSVTKGLLTIEGKRPKAAKPIAPAAYRRLDPAAFRQALFVGLEYRGSANLVGNHVFEVNYGSDERTGSLSRRLTRKGSKLDAPMEFMGGQFSILGTTANGIRVRLNRSIPPQPFGVLVTTTYRIY